MRHSRDAYDFQDLSRHEINQELRRFAASPEVEERKSFEDRGPDEIVYFDPELTKLRERWAKQGD